MEFDVQVTGNSDKRFSENDGARGRWHGCHVAQKPRVMPPAPFLRRALPTSDILVRAPLKFPFVEYLREKT